MNADGQMQVHRVQVGQPPLGASADDTQAAGAVTLLHRRLRGRYPIAITLAALFGAVGGGGGYKSTVPLYTSEAIIRIQPTIKRTLYTTEEAEIPPLFESFVASQATLLESPRVIAQALEEQDLIASGWPQAPEGIVQLRRALSISYKRGSQVILVRVTTKQAKHSQMAANAVIDAYYELYGEEGGKTTTERESKLMTLQTGLRGEIDTAKSSLHLLCSEYGLEDLSEIRRARLAEMLAIEQENFELNQRIASLEVSSSPSEDIQAKAPDLSLAYLATIDPELKDLVARCDEIDAQLTAKRFGPKHLQTRQLEEQREILIARRDARLSTVREEVESAGGLPDSSSLLPQAEHLSLTQAKALLSQNLERHAAVLATMQALAKSQRQIDDKKAEIRSMEGTLATTAQALEQLTVEKENLSQGRILPIYGDLPTQPSKDRRFQLAVLGGMAGAGFGVGLVLLVGLLKPSYRYLDEIEEAESFVPVLGTLPDLNATDEDLESLASLSVHHLRNMLAMQARPRKEGGTAYMITSARPGDGKTSLTVALGLSFAAQNVRVLMIDADLVGHGLTPTMHMDEKEGMRQVAGHGALDDFVYPSRKANVWVLPAGISHKKRKTAEPPAARNGSLEAEHLSTDRMRELIDAARKRFDIILVDTGPLMGSLEANVVAAVVDRVVLTVPRGQDPRLLRAALGRLRSIGAACGGLVFNRATASDLRSSMSTISFHSQSMRANGTESPTTDADTRHALVRAILLSDQSEEPAESRPSK